MDYIKLKNISFEYSKGKKVINNISTKMYKEEITAILGANGSGKTTLGKLTMGILKPINGEIHLFNRDIKDLSLGQIGSKIGYLFQNPEKQFFAQTVEDEVGFVLKVKGFSKEYIDEKVNDLLNLFQLSHLREEFPLRLSQGEKQRLAIAAVLANEPEYLILDEPSKGLDIDRKKTLIKILKEMNSSGRGMTVISHDNDFVNQLSHRVIEMHRGEILHDRRSEN